MKNVKSRLDVLEAVAAADQVDQAGLVAIYRPGPGVDWRDLVDQCPGVLVWIPHNGRDDTITVIEGKRQDES